MAKGTLTLKEFCKLPREEQLRGYAELSDHDKFGARQMDISSSFGPEFPCDNCKHDRGDGTCDAFPKGVTGDQLDEVMFHPDTTVCGDGYRFEPVSKDMQFFMEQAEKERKFELQFSFRRKKL